MRADDASAGEAQLRLTDRVGPRSTHVQREALLICVMYCSWSSYRYGTGT